MINRDLPNQQKLYRLGREIYPLVPKRMSLDEIGAVFGKTRQSVHNESLIVLGKLVWLLRKAVRD